MKPICLISLTLLLAGCGSPPAQQATAPPIKPQSVTLSVTIKGNGSVLSSPAGINCPSESCSASYVSGTQVTLAAIAPAGQVETWSNGCTGTSAACNLTLNADESPAVSFQAASGPQTAQQWRFAACATDGTPGYIIDTSLQPNGESTANVVYEFPSGCPQSLPWQSGGSIMSADGLNIGSSQQNSTVSFLAPFFTLILAAGAQTEIYNGNCQVSTMACLGTVSGYGLVSTTDQPLSGQEFGTFCAACVYQGTVSDLQVTMSLTQTNLAFQGSYNGLNLQGTIEGGSFLIDSANSDPSLAGLGFFVMDSNAVATANLAFYDQNGNFLGSLSPGAGGDKS